MSANRLILALLVSLLLLSNAFAADAPRRPNVVFLLADDKYNEPTSGERNRWEITAKLAQNGPFVDQSGIDGDCWQPMAIVGN